MPFFCLQWGRPRLNPWVGKIPWRREKLHTPVFWPGKKWGHKELDTTERPSHCFSSSHIWMWELDHKESRALKNWCFWTVVLEKTLESPLDYKEIQPLNPQGNQSWIFTEKTDAEAEAPILWPPDVKNWLIGKDPDAGKDWRQEEKGTTEDEMAVWHHWLNGHEFELVIDREAWRAVIHGVAKSRTWLSNWTELIYLKMAGIYIHAAKTDVCIGYYSWRRKQDQKGWVWLTVNNLQVVTDITKFVYKHIPDNYI